MNYVPGMSLLLRHENGEERAILALFGDQSAPGAGWAMEAATAHHPRQAVLADRQMVSFWFKFPEVLPYGEITGKMDQVFTRLEAAAWTISPAVEGMPDTGSNIGGLIDTGDFGYTGPGQDFPATPSAHGYNAADNFIVVAERPGQPPVFTAEEVENLRQLMEELGQTMFGHPISLGE